MVCCMNNIVELVIIIVWTGCSYLMATYMLRLSIVVRRSMILPVEISTI